ncbi:MAG TPA: hypothetical protein VLB83_02830 [Candidatus Paceibacterota bacterium]|nr:hypothetical protein [Candidatus Paceibacterota bacterium]
MVVKVLRVLHTAVAALVCGWPFWYYLFIRHAFGPEGFKEEAMLLCCSFALFAFIQVVFLVVCGGWIWSIWKR